MRSYTIIVFLAAITSAQQIGVTNGASVSSGNNAIDHPNVNNGWQSDSSLFANSGGVTSGSNVFSGIAGGHFSNINANGAINDNTLNNPGLIKVSGNSGWVANGDGNALGAVHNAVAVGAQFKRGYGAVNNYQSVSSPVEYHPAPPAQTTQSLITTPKYTPTLPSTSETPKYAPTTAPVITSSSSAPAAITATYVAPPVTPSISVSFSTASYKKTTY
ncbi:hypothetical protein LPJ73_000825 [Coemansia sp. RSA 2703]|nr:hypothetical protein LPJ73_000825 [Coemansia sp. RSA 2703]KAJ2375516.1 hypothetical protein IW150_002505 [Coemansia sp. RSA 2607]KAJ2397441.1 hypothetical protein GGI05_000635 [Coemansia sp. RSA 2603]